MFLQRIHLKRCLHNFQIVYLKVWIKEHDNVERMSKYNDTILHLLRESKQTIVIGERISEHREKHYIERFLRLKKSCGSMISRIFSFDIMFDNHKDILQSMPIDILVDLYTANIKRYDSSGVIAVTNPHRYIVKRITGYFYNGTRIGNIVCIIVHKYSAFSHHRFSVKSFPKRATKAYMFSLNYPFELYLSHNGIREIATTFYPSEFPYINLTHKIPFGVRRTDIHKHNTTSYGKHNGEDTIVCIVYVK